VEAARALVEAGGPDALSMRKVAAEVGVATTSIYWHVGSRDELLHAVLDAMVAEFPRPVARGRTPRRRIASLASAIRAQVLTTGAVQQVARELGRSGELFLPAQVALAREVSRAGLHGAVAAQAVRSVLFVVGGFVLLEDNYRAGNTAAMAIRERWVSLEDPAIDPRLCAAMAAPTTPDELFDYTVDRLLAAILP
jgi:AcrR family transcriptional regulator